MGCVPLEPPGEKTPPSMEVIFAGLVCPDTCRTAIGSKSNEETYIGPAVHAQDVKRFDRWR